MSMIEILVRISQRHTFNINLACQGLLRLITSVPAFYYSWHIESNSSNQLVPPRCPSPSTQMSLLIHLDVPPVHFSQDTMLTIATIVKIPILFVAYYSHVLMLSGLIPGYSKMETDAEGIGNMDTTSLGSQGDFPSDYPSLASEHSEVSRNDVYTSSSESERIRENKLQQAKDDRVKKSKKCWKILQKSVHSAINIVQDTEIEEISINHGVHHERSISHAKPIQHIIYNPKSKVGAVH